MKYVVGGHGLVKMVEESLRVPPNQMTVRGHSYNEVSGYVNKLATALSWDLRVVSWSENYGKYNLVVETNDLKLATHLNIPKEL